jgi:hypothetical protein
MPIKGDKLYPFRWFYRPEAEPVAAPVVRILEGPAVDIERIPDILYELSERQFAVIREILIEAKFKAEAMLRDEKTISDHGRLAYYSGWVAYADYTLASMEELRAKRTPQKDVPEEYP